jgi:hypothetical protein
MSEEPRERGELE